MSSPVIDEAGVVALETTRIEILRQLNEVEHRLSGTKRKSPYRGELIERKELLLRNLREQKLRISQARKFPRHKGSPISDHAVIRWLERKHRVNVDRLREIMLSEPLKEAITAGHRFWSDGDLAYVIQEGKVVTVMPTSWTLSREAV